MYFSILQNLEYDQNVPLQTFSVNSFIITGITIIFIFIIIGLSYMGLFPQQLVLF